MFVYRLPCRVVSGFSKDLWYTYRVYSVWMSLPHRRIRNDTLRLDLKAKQITKTSCNWTAMSKTIACGWFKALMVPLWIIQTKAVKSNKYTYPVEMSYDHIAMPKDTTWRDRCFLPGTSFSLLNAHKLVFSRCMSGEIL